MLKFLVKVPGQRPYTGLFASNLAARQDAQARFPDAPPASVLNLASCTRHVDALKGDDARRLRVVPADRAGGHA